MNAEVALEFIQTIMSQKKERCLSDVQQAIFRQAWDNVIYKHMAGKEPILNKSGLRDDGSELWSLLKEILETESKVNKSNFKSVIDAEYRKYQKAEKLEPNLEIQIKQNNFNYSQLNWESIPKNRIFYGRARELDKLNQLIVEKHGKVVLIKGMGGIGKSTLAAKFIREENVQNKFDYIFWRSFKVNALSIEEILAELVKFLSDQQETNLPKKLDKQLSILINYLQKYRCLLFIDNLETILLTQDCYGKYRQEYEGYKELIRRVAEESHRSCLVLTSREKPTGITQFEGEQLSICTIPLEGLDDRAAKQLTKGLLYEFEGELSNLIEGYKGNPLALKIVSSYIQEYFNNSISLFLKEKNFVIGDMNNLLDRQFKRLSDLDREILYWLAVSREKISRESIKINLYPLQRNNVLQNAFYSLQRRSLIEKYSNDYWGLQPFILEYITDVLIEEFCNEIENNTVNLLNKIVLLQAEAKDYIREAQINFIVNPINTELKSRLESKRNIKLKLYDEILSEWKKFSEEGYLAGNILNLLVQLEIDVNWVRSVAFHPNDHTVASGSDDQTIIFWEVANGKCRNRLSGYTNRVWSVAVSLNGQTIASGSDDCNVRLWKVSSLENADGIVTEESKILSKHNNWVLTVAFSPNNQTIASGSDDFTIKLWDANTGRCLKSLEGHTNKIWSIAFSLDGKLLASGSRDGKVKLWNVSDRQFIKDLPEHPSQANGIQSVTFCNLSEQEIIAVGCADGSILLWDISTEQYIQSLQGHTKRIWSISFSQNRKLLASGSEDNTIKIWDLSNGECLNTLSGHSNWVRSVSFNHDGKLLASGSEDKTVKIWNTCDVLSVPEALTLEGHTDKVCSVAFNPNSQTVISGSEDSTIKLWNAETGQYLKTYRPKKPYEGMNITRTRGLTDAQKETLIALGAVEDTE